MESCIGERAQNVKESLNPKQVKLKNDRCWSTSSNNVYSHGGSEIQYPALSPTRATDDFEVDRP